MGDHEDLFAEFAERYAETGDAHVPEDWPVDVRRRCLFFVKMLEADPGAAVAERSVVAILSQDGVKADLELTGPEAPPVTPAGNGDRYVIEREIGRGGMGRILLAYDRDFRRRVAMKVLLGPARSAALTSRFVEEAQATAQLEHPNIEPVHDIGLDPGGNPYFTMKWVRGRNLEEILTAREGQPSLIRLVQILEQVAMGVDFAHSRGVVHRDLKPQNIMVGDYGEVLIVDWGLAKVIGKETANAADAVSTSRIESGVLTLEGTVQGSIYYMAPEQARGEVGKIDPRTDVFGLGAILYRVLAGCPMYLAPTMDAALALARRADFVPPSERAPGREVPGELEAVCRKAVARRREDRFQTARELHEALQRYVEGIHDAARRAGEARRMNDDAQQLLGSLRAAEAEAARLRAQEKTLRATVRDHDPEERKAPLWTLLESLGRVEEETERRLREATAAFHAVLSIDPGNRPARAALAEVFHARWTAAEAAGERDAARLYEGLVAQYQDGQYSVALTGEGELRLASEPAGAAVLLSRYEEKGLLLVESPGEAIGSTPLARRLPHGSYMAVLARPGFAAARYPFVIERSAVHAGHVRLHPLGSIADGFIQVPAGESIVGGDRLEFSALPRSRPLVPEIFVGRYPVTMGEYCEFLTERFAGVQYDRDLLEVDDGRRDLVPAFGRQRYVVRERDGLFHPIAQFDPRIPAMSISRAAMLDYCAWLGRRIQKSIRLLTEVEWERCARGADGRLHPWGNGFDWAFCKGGRSRPGESLPEPVGAFRHDRSCFGIEELAGGARELCDGRLEDVYSPCRGGSWFNPFPFVFRGDFRTYLREGPRATDIGFRVAYGAGESR